MYYFKIKVPWLQNLFQERQNSPRKRLLIEFGPQPNTISYGSTPFDFKNRLAASEIWKMPLYMYIEGHNILPTQTLWLSIFRRPPNHVILLLTRNKSNHWARIGHGTPEFRHKPAKFVEEICTSFSFWEWTQKFGK